MKVMNIRKQFKTMGEVESETSPGATYKVVYENGKYTCTCQYNQMKHEECKHIIAFKQELELLREERQNETK